MKKKERKCLRRQNKEKVQRNKKTEICKKMQRRKERIKMRAEAIKWRIGIKRTKPKTKKRRREKNEEKLLGN